MDAIKLNFSRYSNTYEKYAKTQKEAALLFKKYFFIGKGLDLGCGTGFATENIKNSVNDIIGIDISKEMIKKYTEKGFLGINGNIEELPFKDSSFNFAVSNFAIHWTDLDKSFIEIKRVLKKNSKFIFNLPVKGSLEEIYNLVNKRQPFIEKEELILKVKNYFSIERFFIKEYPVYFKNGKEIMLYFKFTGTAISKKNETIGEKAKNYKILSSIRCSFKTSYKVLFLETIR